jgi:hypothetical protein
VDSSRQQHNGSDSHLGMVVPMTSERRTARLAHDMLEIIDNSDNGAPLVKIEEIMMEAVSFALFVRVVNILIAQGLIQVDAQHVAHRVRT